MLTDNNKSKSLAVVKMPYKIKWGNLVLYILLFIGAFIVIFPVLWMIINSFKSNIEIFRMPPSFFPLKATFENYITTWTEVNFSLFIRNTIIISLSISFINCYTSTYLGYLLSKFRFKGRSAVFLIVLISMMFPWSVTIIPLYKMMLIFKVTNTWLPLFLTAFFSAFGIFLMRQFCLTIPNDLIDAARIDGANEFRLFHQIILPMLWPPISALAIFVFLWTWDDFLWQYLNLNSEKILTLTVGLNFFVRDYLTTRQGPILAGTTFSILPILIFYFIFQRKFVEGASLSGLKE